MKDKMGKPRYLDGEPTNLEAAALDALDWLRFWQKYLNEALSFRPAHALRRRVDAAIKALETFLPDQEPIFEESPKSPLFEVDSELAEES